MINYRLISTVIAMAGLCCCSAGGPEPPDEVREALIRDLRIGFVRPSGDVVWPVETLDEPRRFALPLWSKERETRRRIWSSDLQPNPEAVVEGRLRLPIDAAVDILHDGRTYRAAIEGFTVLRAGCGEAEPGWRARIVPPHGSQRVDQDTDGVDDPALWTSPYPHVRRQFPVLVSLDGAPFLPPVTAVDEDLPSGLLAALAEQDLLEGERRSLRTGRLWTVYGARTIDVHGREVGALRTTWRESADGYVKLTVDGATKPTYEEMITKWVDPQNHSYNFDSAVGQVHAKFTHGGRDFFVTRYRGWESELVFLEELRPDGLERVLLDGLDQGC